MYVFKDYKHLFLLDTLVCDDDLIKSSFLLYSFSQFVRIHHIEPVGREDCQNYDSFDDAIVVQISDVDRLTMNDPFVEG